ncbi:HAD-IIB family hydrolase [Photobacterium damselae]|uniref:HAD-IIB family hydrolase n=1 Tax=Photobacterium damselae TaxID=38293 RepID=UPI001EFD2EFA|nr:HAD-IIB family hydrolase [Photobacterium damselae]MCG9780646.1 HAD family hydrolase [Photobacterium damselae]
MTTFIFDIDGTISKNGAPVDMLICDKIASLLNKHRIIFASARAVRDILPLLPDKLHTATFVGCNGGIIWKEGKFISVEYFRKADAKRIIHYLKSHSLPYMINGKWKYSVSDFDHEFYRYLRALSSEETTEDELLLSGVTKILVLNSIISEDCKSYLNKLRIKNRIEKYIKENMFDITPHYCDKYFALKSLGVDFSNCVSFGNDTNDHLMLENSRVSVYVGEHKNFKGANYYCSESDIISVINEIVSNNKPTNKL